jgi:AcrR family transcriptional regulator
MTQARAYRGVALADRVAVRREALVEAGLNCLHADGLAAVSVRSVCSQARLTPRYFYESFADLDALLAAIVDVVCADVATHALDAIAAAPDELGAKIRAAVCSAYTVLASDDRKATAFLVASAGPPSLVERRETWLTEFVQLVLTTLPVRSADTVVGRRAAKAAALFVMGGTTELLRAVFGKISPMPEAEVVEHLTAMWVAVLAA